MTVDVPLCEQHRRHFWLRPLAGGLGFLGFMAAAIVTISIAMDQRGANDSLVPILYLGTGLAFGAWMVAVTIATIASIRPTQITDDFIILTKVADDFAASWKDILDDLQERRRARRRERDEEGDRRRVRSRRDDWDEDR
jgi:hypothetical protein